MNHDKNIMVILSSPSGVGKTTLTKKIQQKYQKFKISVSHTTRKPRPNEIDGVDYHFVDEKKFKELINENQFYEYAKIFDNYYGTSRKSIKVLQEKNYNILFDIDWQGTQQLAKFKDLDLLKIFILPPDKDELKNRLAQRNQDKEEVIEQRLQHYSKDIMHWADYDYVVTNDNLENCFKQIEKIIAEKTSSPIINLFK